MDFWRRAAVHPLGHISLLGAVAGALWLFMEQRRVSRIEAQWEACEPGEG